MKTRPILALGALLAVWLLGVGTAAAAAQRIENNVFLRGVKEMGSGTLRSGEESATDLATAPTVFQVRVLRWLNGTWAPCNGCAVVVYSQNGWLGTYSTDSAGYRNVAGGQYSAGKAYLIVAGWAKEDNSCTGLDWKNTWTAQVNAAVRLAGATSVTIYVSDIKGVSDARWQKLSPSNGEKFADNIYATVDNPISDPFGFESMLGNAGHTLGFFIDGKPYTAVPYDKPEYVGPQLAADYHVWSASGGTASDFQNRIGVTWDTSGKLSGGWTIKTCASHPIQPTYKWVNNVRQLVSYNDGYPDTPLVTNVNLYYGTEPGASGPTETKDINSEICRWRR